MIDPTAHQLSSLIANIRQGHINEIESILQANPPIVNCCDEQAQQPPLYFAALAESQQYSSDVMNLLISYGANINFKDNNDQTVLFYVCREGRELCAQILVEKGLSLDEVDSYGQTPMFYAASENKINIAKRYATKDRVNHVDKLARQTPLFYAARRGHLQMCQLLIERGSDIGHLDIHGKTAIEYAKKAKYTEISQFMINQLRNIREISGGKFSQSLQQSNVQKRKVKEEDAKLVIRQTYKIVYLNEKGESKDITELEIRQLLRDKPELESYFTNPQIIPLDLIQKTNGQNWQKLALKILNLCSKLKGSYWFHEAVDPIKYNILDYFDIIERPMDLGTVRKKLSHNCYSSVEDFIGDMSLIWLNCYKYNGEDHQISRCAQELEKGFREYVVNYGLQTM